MACAIILSFLNAIAFMDSGRPVSAIAAVAWAILAVLQALILTRCIETDVEGEKIIDDVEVVEKEEDR
jgi:hypothetical protein